jgi:hypothetical protein
MPRDTRTISFAPNTADSPIRRALHAGLRALSYKAPTGLAMSESEDDAREGRTHVARLLDTIAQRAFLSGVPYFGAHGFRQMIEKLDHAAREMWGEVGEVDLQTASEQESVADAHLDCFQARQQFHLTRAELEQVVALNDELTHRHAAYRDAARRRIAEMDAATSSARRQLAAS